MGGKEGSRGYLYQSIATVLDSLLDEKWIKVEVEPDTENDKVDIMWVYENNKKKVVQVKSSENNISRADIINWLKDLIEDVKDAENYKLMLIGNCNNETSEFITKINKNNFPDKKKDPEKPGKPEKPEKYSDALKEIIPFISKIEIIFENFQLESLETKINWAVNKLFTKMGYTLNAYVIEQISGAMVYQFAKFSTKGQGITRDEYINIFQEWAYYNYPVIKGNSLVKKALDVAFYMKNEIDFSHKMNCIKKSRNLTSKVQELKESIDAIKRYKLPPKSEESTEEYDVNKFNHDSKEIIVEDLIGFTSREIADKEKKYLINIIKGLLNVDVDRSFFNVGDLRRSNLSLPFTKKEDIGTDDEKEKGSLIDHFIINLYKYEQKFNYLKYLKGICLVPLVLRNNGESSDQGIEVNIKIPKDIEIITKKNMKIPGSFIIRNFTGKGGLLESFARHERDYTLEDYVGEPKLYTPPFMGGIHALHRTKEEIATENNEKFRDYLDDIFDFDIYEEEDQTILQYYFKELNAKKNMAFPAHILVKAEKTFCIEYEITSKNLGNKVIGELVYEIKK
ncbi:hypothetical protein FC685_30410 [Bacillus cereus]|uniref:hypothetical protein n=1 Tax=Bacillus cereus TaxID=1396 RepID=UPI0010BF3048|nr:hypothetical protein [Bacillus cereus]MCU4776232.1 hypothetical protein [Bacillus cereus]TKH79360.1 hypothetical protein FC685_30410 [Bacillus cereus]